jgi:mycothiol synthase
MTEATVRPMQLRMRHSDLEKLPAPEMAAGYRLRTWRWGDESALAALLSEAFSPTVWTPVRVLEILPWCKGLEPESIFVLEGPGGDVAGTASSWDHPKWPDDGYLHYVAVGAAHRGRNLGATVSLAALDFMRRRRGRRTAVLETDDQRLPALATYFRLGFEPLVEDEAVAARWQAVREALGRRG